MILLADGGSSKVEWCLIEGSRIIKQIFTKGANPYFRTREDISEEIKNILLPEIKEYTISEIHFFGAGCAFPEKNKIIETALSDNLQTEKIEVGSDLLAAAKALCGNEKGIACILGTGSNSCFYDGKNITTNVSPLGYILGDEGSGAVLGRLFLNACLKNQLTKGLKEKFLTEYKFDQASILENVYKQPLANRFLAGISPFIIKNIDDKTIFNLVYHTFSDFFIKNVMQYDYKNNPVHFTGSIAYYYKEILTKVASDMGIHIGTISKSPMEGLIRYYQEPLPTSPKGRR